MTTKHTQGQWYIEHVPYDHIRAIQEDLPTVCVWADDYKPEANAHLIASAPDLLEALEIGVKNLNDESDPWVISAKVAIAKAKGE